MLHIVVTFIVIATGQLVDVGVSKQAFDTKEACQAAIETIVSNTNEELASQGMKIGTAECLNDEELKKFVIPLPDNN